MNDEINKQIKQYVDQIIKLNEIANKVDGSETSEIKFTITAEFTWSRELK